mgnify:CR=1 FL=1
MRVLIRAKPNHISLPVIQKLLPDDKVSSIHLLYEQNQLATDHTKFGFVYKILENTAKLHLLRSSILELDCLLYRQIEYTQGESTLPAFYQAKGQDECARTGH